jgi:predicted membrane channel-forming protein YqfA (hemolysin III family)
MSEKVRTPRALKVVVLVTIVGIALGSIYYRVAGDTLPRVAAALSILAALLIIWIGIRQEGPANRMMRIAAFLLGGALLVAALTELIATYTPPFVQLVATSIAAVGGILGVIGYINARAKRSAPAQGLR